MTSSPASSPYSRMPQSHRLKPKVITVAVEKIDRSDITPFVLLFWERPLVGLIQTRQTPKKTLCLTFDQVCLSFCGGITEKSLNKSGARKLNLKFSLKHFIHIHTPSERYKFELLDFWNWIDQNSGSSCAALEWLLQGEQQEQGEVAGRSAGGEGGGGRGPAGVGCQSKISVFSPDAMVSPALTPSWNNFLISQACSD